MSLRSGKKRATNRAIVDFDSADNHPQTNAPGSSSSGATIQSTIVDNNDLIEGTNVTETEVLITNCVRYILHNENSKLSIKQMDINNHLCENFQLDRSKINHLMKMVRFL